MATNHKQDEKHDSAEGHQGWSGDSKRHADAARKGHKDANSQSSQSAKSSSR